MSHRRNRRVVVPPPEPPPKPAPVVAQHLNYKGDRRAAVGQVMGPNTMREALTVIEAHYDPETDRTRLGLAYGIHRLEGAPS